MTYGLHTALIIKPAAFVFIAEDLKMEAEYSSQIVINFWKNTQRKILKTQRSA
jgi:hypothetical protein